MALRRILPSWARHTPPAQCKNNENPPRVYPLPHRPAPLSGTKRSRSGRPMSPDASSDSHGPSTSSSESESDDSSSSSGSDSDQDRYREDPEESEHQEHGSQEYTLGEDLELQSLMLPLLQLAYDKAMSWISSTRYVVPPEDRLPPHKRARTANWRLRSTRLAEEDDHSDSELVVVSHRKEYFHLACPFYVSNPKEYERCLLQHDLHSIEEVIDHLRREHTQPPYCPICYRSFNGLLERNHHIRARSCEVRNSGDIDGINDYRKARLSKRDRLYLCEKKRWLRLWATVFPKMECLRSPYLENPFEREVSMARDYWRSYGRGIVARYLASRSLLNEDRVDEERRQVALCKSTLEGLVSKISEEHRTT